jgi:large subunit ribosomal protein L23
MTTAHEVLKRPLLTEKASTLLESHNQYAFEVATWANKVEIKRAVEELFRVKVIAVTTQVRAGKPARLGRFEGRKPSWKRAMVTLKVGDKIEVFEKI